MLSLYLSEIQDPQAQENFKQIQAVFDLNPLIKGTWIFKELTFTVATTNLPVPHGLSFVPKDVIITNKTGAGTFTVNYALIDKDNINVTASGACVARLLVGRLGA